MSRVLRSEVRRGPCNACGHACENLGEVTLEDRRTIVRWCSDCWNLSVKARKQARKEQLAAMARCEVDGCERRGTWNVGSALLCGIHKRNVAKAQNRQVAACGILAMLTPQGRDSILHMAKTERT